MERSEAKNNLSSKQVSFRRVLVICHVMISYNSGEDLRLPISLGDRFNLVVHW